MSVSVWRLGRQAGQLRLGSARSLSVLVKDAGGEPLGEAEVRLLRWEYDDPETALQVERTTAAGIAYVSPVPGGSWYLHVSHARHASKVVAVPPEESGDIVEIRLEAGVRIVGSVRIAGRASLPGPGRVFFDSDRGSSASHSVETDLDGRYASRTAFLPSDALEVAALVPGFGEARKQVDLGSSPSGELVVDFLLESPERFAVGRVVDPEGAALAAVEVFTVPLVHLPPDTVLVVRPIDFLMGLPDFQANAPKESMSARMRRAATSDSMGRFRIGGLDATRAYKVLLVSEKHANALEWVPLGEPGETVDLGTIQLQLPGRVWGHVRTPEGTPLEGVLVYTFNWQHLNVDVKGPTEIPTPRPTTLTASLDAITNSEGFFAIEPIAHGEVYLRCLGSSYGPYPVPLAGPIEIITEDKRQRGSDRRIPVVLSVVDETLAPVKAYGHLKRVRPGLDSNHASTVDDLINWAWDVSDESGRLRLDTTEVGTYSIEVRDVRGQLTTEAFVIELTMEGLEREVVLLPAPDPAQPLSGSVMTSAGSPLSGMQVTLIPDTGSLVCNCLRMTVSSDEKGEFSFGTFMKGNHRLIVTDPGGVHPATPHFPAHPGESIVVTME